MHTDRLVAVLLQDAAAELAAQRHVGQVGHGDRSAGAGVGLDHDVLDVLGIPDPAHAAHDVLRVPLLHGLAAHGGVGAGHGGKQLAERHVVGPQLVGVDVDLVLDGHPAHRGHLSHARHRVQLVADVPVLDRAEPAQVVALALDRVPEDLPQRGGVLGQVGHNARGQERAGQGQPLQYPLAREVEVDLVLEDDVDHREVELAGAPHRLHPGQPLEVHGERVGDLVLDLARAAPHPVGEHDRLVLGQVGNGVHRGVDHRVNPPDEHAESQQDHDEPVAHGKLDDLLDHGREFSCWLGSWRKTRLAARPAPTATRRTRPPRSSSTSRRGPVWPCPRTLGSTTTRAARAA